MSMWDKLQEYLSSGDSPMRMYSQKGDEAAIKHMGDPHRRGRYPVADAMMKVATLPFRPITLEEAKDPIVQAYLGDPNPLDKSNSVQAMTRMAKILSPEKVKAIRNTIEGMSGALTREEAMRQLKKASEYETSTRPIIAKTPFDTLKKYLAGYIGRQEHINPESKMIAQGVIEGTHSNPLEKLNPRKAALIQEVEDVIGQRTPLHYETDFPKLRETTNLKNQVPTDDLDYKMIKQAESPDQDIFRVEPIKKTTQEGVGAFRFEINKTPEGVFIQPTNSMKYKDVKDKDIATKVYKMMEQKFGGKIIPDEVQTEAGKALHIKQGFGKEFGIPIQEVSPEMYNSMDDRIRTDNLDLVKTLLKNKKK